MNIVEYEWIQHEREATRKTMAGVTLAGVISIVLWSLVLCLISGCQQDAYAFDIDMKKIAEIESSNNPMAWNKRDDSRGLYQITPVVVKEWNNYHPNDLYTIDDMWDPDKNFKIADWYMHERIPAMLYFYKIPDTVEHRIVAYNFGIGNLVRWYREGGRFDDLPIVTRRYIKTYWGMR